MDRYFLANKLLSENYSDEYIQESMISILPNVVMSMVLGATSIGAYKLALKADGDNLAKKIQAKIDSLKGKPTEKLNPMQRLRVKLSDAVDHSNVFLHHAFEEVIKTGKTENAAKKIASKIKLDDEEIKSLETYLTAIVHKIKTTKPLTDA